KHVRLEFGGEPDEPFLPFKDGGFRTPGGKAEFYSESLKDDGLDPVVQFIPPQESRHNGNKKEYSLELLARKADNFLNSTFSNIPVVQQMEEVDLLEISPEDAQTRGIASGDQVRVKNDRGEIQLTSRISQTVQPGGVAARLNWGRFCPGHRNVNVLTSEKLTDMGNSATFYSVLVEVELVKVIPRAPERRADLDAAPRST